MDVILASTMPCTKAGGEDERGRAAAGGGGGGGGAATLRERRSPAHLIFILHVMCACTRCCHGQRAGGSGEQGAQEPCCPGPPAGRQGACQRSWQSQHGRSSMHSSRGRPPSPAWARPRQHAAEFPICAPTPATAVYTLQVQSSAACGPGVHFLFSTTVSSAPSFGQRDQQFV